MPSSTATGIDINIITFTFRRSLPDLVYGSVFHHPAGEYHFVYRDASSGVRNGKVAVIGSTVQLMVII